MIDKPDICPNCGEDMQGSQIIDASGDTPSRGMFYHLGLHNGELAIQIGIECDACGWETISLFVPEETQKDDI